MVKEHMTKLSDGIFNDEDDVDNDEVFEGDDENEIHTDDDEEDVDDCSTSAKKTMVEINQNKETLAVDR